MDIWSRQKAIPGFGADCQERLRKSKVAVLGLGGVGGPAALYLAAAGVGKLVLVDGDRIEASNLNRQILFSFADLGRPKVQAGCDRLVSINPDLEVDAVEKRLWEGDLASVLVGCHFVLDCFDRNVDRLAVNRECLRQGLPAAHSFAQDFSGEVFTVEPDESSCLACALDETFPEQQIVPVMGVATGMVGITMANAAILRLTGLGDPQPGVRLICDLAFPGITKIPVTRNPRCPDCGKAGAVGP